MDFFETTDQEKIGLGLTGVGIFFCLLGITLFFNERLIAIGNTLLICGVSLTIGLNASMQLLLKRSNFQGTILFAIGFFFIVIMGWPFWGMLMEGCGLFLLSSGFWPSIAVFLPKILALGWLLLQQFIRSVENIQRRSISADSRVENSRTEVNENRSNDAGNEFDQETDEDAESYRYTGEILSSMDAGNTLPVPVIEPGSGKQTDKASRRSFRSKWLKFWGRSKPRKSPSVELVESSGAKDRAALYEHRLAREQNLSRLLDELQAKRDLFSRSPSQDLLEEIAFKEANVAIEIQQIAEINRQLNSHG